MLKHKLGQKVFRPITIILLLVGRVPDNNLLLAGRVPDNKLTLAGNVPHP